MTLTDLSLLASIASSLAVAASLVYLAVGVHQNSRHTRAQIQQARVSRLMEQMIGFSDADKCAAYIRGNGGDPTPEAISDRQFSMQCLAQIGTIMDAFTQYNDGLLNRDQFEAVSETYRLWFTEPGFQDYWTTWKAKTGIYSASYVVFFDSLLPSGESGRTETQSTG